MKNVFYLLASTFLFIYLAIYFFALKSVDYREFNTKYNNYVVVSKLNGSPLLFYSNIIEVKNDVNFEFLSVSDIIYYNIQIGDTISSNKNYIKKLNKEIN